MIAFLAITTFAACSGAHQLTTLPIVGQAPAHDDAEANGHRRRGHISLTIFVPRKHHHRHDSLSWHDRSVRPGYVSAATQSVTISVNGGSPAPSNIGERKPGCESASPDEIACTIPLEAPIGKDSIEVKLAT
jgi:hypothetical protein